MSRSATAIALATGLLALVVLPVQAQSTLAAVKKRGELVCGVNGQLPGFSVQNNIGWWTGFEVDYCRAVAAAVLGDGLKVRFVPLTAAHRFDALRAGQVDVLMRNTTATLERTAHTGVRDAVVTFIDAQTVVVAKSLNIKELGALNGKSVCLLRGTPYRTRIEEWFGERKQAIQAVMFDTQDAMFKAFFAGECAAVSQDISPMAASIIASGRAGDYLMLPEVIAKDPLAAYVRAGDEEWLDVVRWTHFALVEAEERGITQANVDEFKGSRSTAVRHLLGLAPGNGKALGLDEAWAYNAIKQVGNYAEVYERNVGAGSMMKFARGINALWYRGGVMYPLPMQW